MDALKELVANPAAAVLAIALACAAGLIRFIAHRWHDDKRIKWQVYLALGACLILSGALFLPAFRSLRALGAPPGPEALRLPVPSATAASEPRPAATSTSTLAGQADPARPFDRSRGSSTAAPAGRLAAVEASGRSRTMQRAELAVEQVPAAGDRQTRVPLASTPKCDGELDEDDWKFPSCFRIDDGPVSEASAEARIICRSDSAFATYATKAEAAQKLSAINSCLADQGSPLRCSFCP